MKLLLALVFMNVVAHAQAPAVQTGDVIFHTSTSQQAAAIIKATDSPFSHVGIIEVVGANTYVVEAIQPVTRTKLSNWIKRGYKGRYAIYRNESLSVDKQAEIVARAKDYLGRDYDIHFTSVNKNIYCSELIDYAYRDAALDIGTYQKVKDLNMDHGATKQLVERRWKTHPLCRGRVTRFEDCWALILEDELVTPASLAADPQLKQVWTNYP